MTRSHIAELAVLATIIVAAGALRLTRLDTFIASDELRWVCRSVNFMTALGDGRPSDTFQVGHPGVLTMWLGAAALRGQDLDDWPDLCRESDGGRDLSKFDDVGQEGVLQTIAPLLTAARRGPALAGALLLCAVYAVLRLGGVPALFALTGVGLVAFDPFLLAHNRVLHLDALEALAALLAVTALAAQQVRRPGRLLWAVAAGVPAGLALVAKSSALVLVPLLALFLGARVLAAAPDRRPALARAIRDGLGWGLGAAAAAIAVWPALWAAPVQTVMGVLTKASEEGGSPHSGGNFFLGRPVDDPGPLFYPVAAAFRVTPAATFVIGVAALLALLWLWARLRRTPSRIKWLATPTAVQIVAAVAWAGLFMVVMTAGPKKFDRYALPSLAALNLAGGLALAALAVHVASRHSDPSGRRRRLAWAACVIAVVAQAWAAARALPYGLAYYNPLLGGPQVARRALLVGWGEGYNLAAAYLNQLPGADKLEVSVPGVANFAPLFVGRTRSAEGYREGRTDYAVLYISKVQRQRNEDLLDQFVGLEPDWRGEIAGLPYVAVYGNRTLQPLDSALTSRLQNGDVIIADGESAFAKRHERLESPDPIQDTQLIRTWGHWGEKEVSQALDDELAPTWRRVWVVRYPEHDPDAAIKVMSARGEASESVTLADGALELTLFEPGGAAGVGNTSKGGPTPSGQAAP